MARKANAAPPPETPEEPVEPPVEKIEEGETPKDSADEPAPAEVAMPDKTEPVEISPELSEVDISGLPGCPLVGDSVHYIAKGSGDRRAAIVTKVNEPGNPISAVSLRVFNPDRDYTKHDVPYSAKPEGWQWKRVEALPKQ